MPAPARLLRLALQLAAAAAGSAISLTGAAGTAAAAASAVGPAGSCSVWPAPKLCTTGSLSRTLGSDFSFVFVAAGARAAGTPPTLAAAFARYADLTRPHRSALATGKNLIHSLAVSISAAGRAETEKVPQQGADETYAIRVPAASGNAARAAPATLHAATIVGALRGLETFSQLVRYNFSAAPRAPSLFEAGVCVHAN